MKQVIQSRRSGKLALKNVPATQVRAGHLLVRTRASLISAGTERMVVDFAKKNLAGKAQARPDLVKKALAKAKKEGLWNTWKAVMARLDEPLPLGYSAAGEVIAVGAGLEAEFRVGDRVAMAGAGIANHAELNAVPRNLVAKIPDNVSDDDACYGTVGAISMHAVRNLKVGLSDIVGVIGCGLVGQLAIQFLTLSGARVIAFDYADDRLDLALKSGAIAALKPDENASNIVQGLSAGRGADAVLISAATSSSEPFNVAADIARDRANIVMVGLTGTTFPYQTFMTKELNLTVSRSYGPGRYDPDFEGRGVKYPEGWVRWTETENLGETVRLLAPDNTARLDVASLTSHRFPLENAEDAYTLVTSGTERHLGVVLTYSGDSDPKQTVQAMRTSRPSSGACVIGAIGAGNFARAVLLPALKPLSGVRLKTLATQRGASAENGAETHGFENAATDIDSVMSDAEINSVIIATRHDSHAAMTAQALRAGKSVFVEKPLALDIDQLNDVIDAINGADGFVQVGFNRRFAPQTTKLCDHFKDTTGPKVVTIRVNGGAIEGGHWTQSSDEGGGRVLGEICHFVDLARHLVGAAISNVRADAATAEHGSGDDVIANLSFVDGSIASIIYTARGDTSLPKERIEVFAGGRAGVLDDFQSLTLAAGGKTTTLNDSQDKGHKQQIAAFVDCVTNGGAAPIDEGELVETSAATIAILESLRTGNRIDI
ncbi:bi-domain-containing oxidoreductase [Rhodospirillales bacterium]|nr:bi-domain-containing oxidoreductase [Rhodospirillales bacterium]